MSMEDDYDYWTEEPRAKPSASEPVLAVETIEGVEPLDTQLGVATPLTVPVVLHDALFGQPEPTEAEIAAHGGDPACVSPMHTYAILDAAKVQGLPEMLETSGLPHRCLFKGDAYDELKDVAPWIVQIEEGNAFTRNLFTSSDAPWHLWDKEPGIYIRSRSTLDEVWGHFRKFTRVRDEKGKWFYLRYFESDYAAAYFAAVSKDHESANQWLRLRDGRTLNVICISSERGKVVSFTAIPDALTGVNKEFRLSYIEDRVFEAIKLKRFHRKLRTHLADQYPAFVALEPQEQDQQTQRIVQEAYAHNLHIERAVADYAEARVLLGWPPADDPVMQRILNSGRHPLDRAAFVLAEARTRR